jgi:hypothetical protein
LAVKGALTYQNVVLVDVGHSNVLHSGRLLQSDKMLETNTLAYCATQ